MPYAHSLLAEPVRAFAVGFAWERLDEKLSHHSYDHGMTKSALQRERDCGLARLVTITISFNPDLNLLRSQLSALPAECLKLVIDNASPSTAQRAIRELGAVIPNMRLLINSSNLGLAAAINQGVGLAREIMPEGRYCLLLDQDSEPQAGSVAALVARFEALQAQGLRVACVGPLLVDAATGLSHGFHRATYWRWRRIYPAPDSIAPVSCTNLNGSGTLVPIDLFLQLGSLDEHLFIDHVDTEWSFRVLAQGYTLWGIPQAVFRHRMGQGSLRYWLFGWRVWPARSPARHRLLFRNAVWLMRRPYVPRVWKFWAMVKLALTFTIHTLIDPQRGPQVRAILQGLREGLQSPSLGLRRP